MSVSVEQFVRSHLPRGETVTETGSGTSRNALPTYNLGLSLTCVSPHVTFCGVYYQTTEAMNGEEGVASALAAIINLASLAASVDAAARNN